MTVPAGKVAGAVDESTLLVPLTLVCYKSSYLQDVAPIIEKAHACGAYVILDVYQAAGVVPIDVRKLDVDAVVGGSIKWLCGGPGAAYLYVKQEVAARLRPRLTGWIAHANPFAFADDMEYAPDAGYRFLTGTPHIPAFFAAKPGFEIIRDVGVDRIRARSLELTGRIIDRAREAGITLNTPVEDDRRGGTVVLQMENSREVCAEIVRKKFLVDWRPNAGIRVSPHFYTTNDEVDAFMDETVKIMNKIQP